MTLFETIIDQVKDHDKQLEAQGDATPTLDDLRQAEWRARGKYMYYEAAERGYDKAAARQAYNDYLAAKERREKAEAEQPPARAYTATLGTDGTHDTLDIRNSKGEVIASLYFWDEPDTDEAARAEESAQLIVEHLNRWQIDTKGGAA